MKAVEIREIATEELVVKANELKEELFNLKFQLSLGQFANTAKIRASHKGITPAQLFDLYKSGESLVFSIASNVPVRDTLFRSRKDFSIDSLNYIPFSGGEVIQMQAIVKKVSGVDVPLFEAKIPYKSLLKGLDNQLRINLDYSRTETNRYPGLQVGSVTAPNNNAGNWE